jgi:hypothetical protein
MSTVTLSRRAPLDALPPAPCACGHLHAAGSPGACWEAACDPRCRLDPACPLPFKPGLVDYSDPRCICRPGSGRSQGCVLHGLAARAA